MMHQLLSPPTNRRFFTLFRHVFFEPRKWHDTDVAWEQQWKLMSTAAASELPNIDNGRTKKRVVSPNQRRKMVEAYVDEYRVMNDGRFPTACDVQKHVGGSYYNVKPILQKYVCGCKLSAVAAGTKTSTTGQTAQVNGISDSGIASDSQFPDDRTAILEDCGISVELYSNCKVGVDKSSCENMDDVSTPNKHYEITTTSVSGCDRKVDLEVGEEWHDASVAWEQQWKLMSTAAASEIPNNNNVSTKKRAVSPNQRRKMVEAYVVEYRVMNAGRFPTACDVQKHVGGSYYNVKAILQEYVYGCKLSAVAAATKTSTTGQTAPVNGISDSGMASDSQLPDDRTAVVEDCGISVELLSNCKVGVDTNSCENMDDVSTLNKHYEITTTSVSGCDGKVDLELGGECGNTFGDMDMRDKNNSLEIPGVPVTLSLVEDTSAHETLMALEMGDPEFLAKPSHRPNVTGTSRNPEPQEIDKSADQALESDESKGVMDIGKLSTVLSEKTQQGGVSYNNNSAITQELDNSTVGAEMKITSDIGMPLDCELRIGRIAAKNDCRVSTDDDSSSQKADNCSCQKMIDESILSENKEVTTDDVHGKEKTVDLKLMREHLKTSSTNVDGGDYIRSESEELSQQRSMMDTSAVSLNATASENGEVSSTPSLPSEVPATSPNSDIDETVSSAQASKSGEISRGTTVQQTREKQTQESSLWVNVKLLASNIMSFWRKT